MKIRPVGAQLFHEDGRMDRPTDMTKLIVAFRNFMKAPKNVTGFDLAPFKSRITLDTWKLKLTFKNRASYI